MVDAGQIQAYLKGISRRYEQWRQDNALTDTIAHQQATFTFNQFVQTEEKQSGDPLKKESKLYPLFEGIRHYLLEKAEHVLLVGSPGVGKSSALWQYLNELAEKEKKAPEPRIPVLVQLKAYRDSYISAEDPYGLLTLIQISIRPHLRLSLPEIDDLLCDQGLILLLDGLNEMPAGVFRTHLQQFRDECRELKIPLICSTREMGGGDLGIQRKLEIQPLNSGETTRFLQECLPEHQGQVRQLLQRDNRDLSRTPFVLWMLYHLLQETGTIAETLGEAFRQFFRFYCRRYKEDAPVPEERRKVWNSWMEHLAFTMLSSPDPLDPGLVITKEKAENILAKRFGELQGNDSRILELEKYYLLAPLSDIKTSFKHQLIQEYYAAESLLEKLEEEPHLLQEQSEQGYTHFQIHHLNYLKWRETIFFMFGLTETNRQADILTSLAMDVDLHLGARAAGQVRPKFHCLTIQKICNLQVPDWLRSELIASSESDHAFDLLINQALEDVVPLGNVVSALCKVRNDFLENKLIQVLQNSSPNLKHNAACLLCATLGMQRSFWIALRNLENEHPNSFESSIAILELIESAIPFPHAEDIWLVHYSNEEMLWIVALLPKLINSVNLDISAFKPLLNRVFKSIMNCLYDFEGTQHQLEDIDKYSPQGSKPDINLSIGNRICHLEHNYPDKEEKNHLLEILKGGNIHESALAASELTRFCYAEAVPSLLDLFRRGIENQYGYAVEKAINALGKIKSQESVPYLSEAIDRNHIRGSNLRHAAFALASISGRQAIDQLLAMMRSGDLELRISAAMALNSADINLDHRQITEELVPLLLDSDRGVRGQIASLFEEKGHVEHCPELMNAYISTREPWFLSAIWAIQSRCGVYSFSIQQKANQEFEQLIIAEETSQSLSVELLSRIDQITQKIDKNTLQMSNEPKNDFSGANFHAPVNFGDNPKGDFIKTQNNFHADAEMQSAVSELKILLTQLQDQNPSVNTESEALTIIDAEFTEVRASRNHKLETLQKQLLNPERHLQACKAAAGEVAKHYLEDSVWAKAIITYIDKLSEEPGYGA